MAAFSTAALLVCLLLGPLVSLAAIATIDVGAAATIGNVWRPASCDAVKDGVVLTNMVANVKAIIDGCTITLPSTGDASTAAVNIASFGAGSSIELRNCDISATFTTGGQSAAIRFGTLAAGNSILLSNTTVTAVGINIAGMFLSPGDTGSSAAVTVADGSAFHVQASALTAAIRTADGSATFGASSVFKFVDSSAVLEGRSLDALYILASFGDHGVISLLRSNITTIETSSQRNAVSRAFHLTASLSDHCSVSISHSTINATGPLVEAVQFKKATYGSNFSISVLSTNITAMSELSRSTGLNMNQPTIGAQFALSVADSVVTAKAASGEARALRLTSMQIGSNASIKVTDSTFNGTGQNAWMTQFERTTFSGRPTFDFIRSNIWGKATASGFGPSVCFLSSTWSNEGAAVTIDSSRFYSSAGFGSALLLFGSFPAFTINVMSSVLEAITTQEGDPPGGVISFSTSSAWNGGSLTLSHSELTLLDGTTAASEARFVQWPNTISGFVPQTFDNVTLSAPAGVLTAAFTVNSRGTYSANTTFCANNVKWANGTAVVSGPPEFTAVATCQDTVTSTASLSATASPHVSKSLSLSPPASPTLTAPRTASAAPSKTTPRSKTATLPPTKTIPRTATPLTPAPATPAPETPTPATPAPETPIPATPAPAASSSASGSAPTPAPVTPSPLVRSSQSSAATPAPALMTPAPVVQASSASSASTASSPAPTPAPQQSSRSRSSASTPVSTPAPPGPEQSTAAGLSAAALLTVSALVGFVLV